MGKVTVQAKLNGKVYTKSFEGVIPDSERVSITSRLMRSIHDQLAKEGMDVPGLPMEIKNEW